MRKPSYLFSLLVTALLSLGSATSPAATCVEILNAVIQFMPLYPILANHGVTISKSTYTGDITDLYAEHWVQYAIILANGVSKSERQLGVNDIQFKNGGYYGTNGLLQFAVPDSVKTDRFRQYVLNHPAFSYPGVPGATLGKYFDREPGPLPYDPNKSIMENVRILSWMVHTFEILDVKDGWMRGQVSINRGKEIGVYKHKKTGKLTFYLGTEGDAGGWDEETLYGLMLLHTHTERHPRKISAGDQTAYQQSFKDMTGDRSKPILGTNVQVIAAAPKFFRNRPVNWFQKVDVFRFKDGIEKDTLIQKDDPNPAFRALYAETMAEVRKHLDVGQDPLYIVVNPSFEFVNRDSTDYFQDSYFDEPPLNGVADPDRFNGRFERTEKPRGVSEFEVTFRAISKSGKKIGELLECPYRPKTNNDEIGLIELVTKEEGREGLETPMLYIQMLNDKYVNRYVSTRFRSHWSDANEAKFLQRVQELLALGRTDMNEIAWEAAMATPSYKALVPLGAILKQPPQWTGTKWDTDVEYEYVKY